MLRSVNAAATARRLLCFKAELTVKWEAGMACVAPDTICAGSNDPGFQGMPVIKLIPAPS